LGILLLLQGLFYILFGIFKFTLFWDLSSEINLFPLDKTKHMFYYLILEMNGQRKTGAFSHEQN